MKKRKLPDSLTDEQKTKLRTLFSDPAFLKKNEEFITKIIHWQNTLMSTQLSTLTPTEKASPQFKK